MSSSTVSEDAGCGKEDKGGGVAIGSICSACQSPVQIRIFACGCSFLGVNIKQAEVSLATVSDLHTN